MTEYDRVMVHTIENQKKNAEMTNGTPLQHQETEMSIHLLHEQNDANTY